MLIGSPGSRTSIRSRSACSVTDSPPATQLVPVRGADVDDPLTSVSFVGDHLVDHGAVVAGLELLGTDQQPQPRLVERVGELVRAVGRVDVHHDRADLRGGVLHQRPLRRSSAPRCRPGRPWRCRPPSVPGPARSRRRRARRRSTAARTPPRRAPRGRRARRRSAPGSRRSSPRAGAAWSLRRRRTPCPAD